MLQRIAEGLGPLGLILRGGFHPRPEDGVPALGDGASAGTLVLVGNAGPAMWQAFRAAPEAADGEAHPLDRWIARCLGGLVEDLGAEDLGAEARFPFEGPPYLPFQRWAARAEGLKASPLGILIHPRFGLWHAYRGALAFREALALPASPEAACPCDACAEKPCLQVCPVGAFTAGGYAVPACRDHLGRAEGRDCRDRGCLARRACPVGREYLYDPEQAAFHMAAFVGSSRDGSA